MDAREEIPRISVENLQAWQRIETAYRREVLRQFEEEVKEEGIETESEALRAHILHFIERTFATARPNLRVNGHPYELLENIHNDTEPFDEALDRRIWSMAETRLQWIKRAAETRRSVPQNVANQLDARAEENQAFEAQDIPDTATERSTFFENESDIGLKHHENKVVQRLNALGGELGQTIPEQLERLQRVKVVATDIKTHKL